LQELQVLAPPGMILINTGTGTILSDHTGWNQMCVCTAHNIDIGLWPGTLQIYDNHNFYNAVIL